MNWPTPHDPSQGSHEPSSLAESANDDGSMIAALQEMPDGINLKDFWPDAASFLVIAEKWDPRTVASNGDTVLMMLAHNNLGALVSLVIERGWCDPAAVNGDGYSAWQCAAHQGALDALEALASALVLVDRNVQTAKGESALHLASDQAPAVIRALLKHGVSPDLGLTEPGPLNGATALMFCAEAFEVKAQERVKALLDAGASIEPMGMAKPRWRGPLLAARPRPYNACWTPGPQRPFGTRTGTPC